MYFDDPYMRPYEGEESESKPAPIKPASRPVVTIPRDDEISGQQITLKNSNTVIQENKQHDAIMDILNFDDNGIVQDFILRLEGSTKLTSKIINEEMEHDKLVDKVLNSIGIRTEPMTVLNFSKKYMNPTQAFRIHEELYFYLKERLLGKRGGKRGGKSRRIRSKRRQTRKRNTKNKNK